MTTLPHDEKLATVSRTEECGHTTPQSTPTMASPFRQAQENQWSYRLFGPTTLHLQHEFYMWISLSLLTLATLKSLYRQALQSGDMALLLCVSFWLSRHFVKRWLLTTDTSTAKNPTLLGVMLHWFTSYIQNGGLYMDRPDVQVVAKNTATSPPENHSLLPSLSYTLHYIRTCILYPIRNIRQKISGSDSSTTSSPQRLLRRNSSTSATANSNYWRSSPYFKWITWWKDNGPSIQMMLSIVVAIVMLYDIFSHVYPGSTRTVTTPPTSSDLDLSIQPRGAYQALDPPKFYRLLLFLARTPVLLSLFWYGRIALPIADLVAGQNVLKSVRAESLLYGQSAASGVASSGKSKVKQQFVKEDAPWAERFKSIAVENRFRLFLKVAGIRIVDGLIACTVLPRTSLACRLTGHCPQRPALWELTSILNPIGLTGPNPTASSTSMLHSVIPDRASLVIIILSVVLITSLLLLAQAVVLNGSYLAIMGYISGEWTLVEDPPQYFEAPANWDPKRRYKKGDLILVHSRLLGAGRVYRAATNNPEGRPFDLCLRATHYLFCNELGHASTSRVICIATKIQMAFVAVVFCMLVCCWLMDYGTGALLTALLANLIACYGLATVGMMDYGELETVANEIRPPVRKERASSSS